MFTDAERTARREIHRRARRLDRAVFQRRGLRLAVHAGRMVCGPQETNLESAQLDLRPGLVRALHDDGCGGVACLATRWLQGQPAPAVAVPDTIVSQRPLVLVILRLEKSRARVRRNRPALAGHQWNDRRVLAEGAHGRLAARAVSGVGQLRLRVELHTLAIEPLKTEQTP